MKPMRNIPAGWMEYTPIGNQVPGTRFIAFKVPLRENYVDKLKPDSRFTVPILLERVPELGLIIDLTQTVRYYNKNEVLDRGVDYVKIPTPGQAVPTQQYVDRFFEVVDYYLDTHKGDDSLIGVHCTHGVNRTGYMLCRYLIQRLGYPVEEAIAAVGSARGHPIERTPYLISLRENREATLKKSTRGDLEEESGLTDVPHKLRGHLRYCRRRTEEEVLARKLQNEKQPNAEEKLLERRERRKRARSARRKAKREEARLQAKGQENKLQAQGQDVKLQGQYARLQGDKRTQTKGDKRAQAKGEPGKVFRRLAAVFSSPPSLPPPPNPTLK